MYSIIENIIDHSWNTNNYNSSEQQIIYYIIGCLIVIFSVVFIDLVYRVFSNFWKSKR